MSRPSSNAWVHLRGEDNERTVCGEENRIERATKVRASNFETISTQLAAEVTCPRCCMELIKRREARERYCVVVTFEAAEDAAEFINNHGVAARTRLFKASELAKGVKP